MPNTSHTSARDLLKKLAAERILVLDGAMGTMIQEMKLDEQGYRGARFDAWNREVRGNNDLLNLSRPDAIREIHYAYYKAGADIVSTNTFSSTSIAQADYGLSDIAYELNCEGARLAREAANKAAREDGRPRFVAGALGPTNRTASISPDVANPGYRAITFDQLRDGLRRAGAGTAHRRRRSAADRNHLRHAQRQGRDLRHRRAVRGARRRGAGDDLRHHHRPLGAVAVGPDAGGVLERGATRLAGLGRIELRARRRADARAYRRAWRGSATRSFAPIRTPACRTSSGTITRGPEEMARHLGEFAETGLINIVGGCCGTTPEHISAIAEAVRGKAPRAVPEMTPNAAAVGPGAVHARAGNSLRQRRRANQRHRLGQIPQARHRGRLHGGAGDRARPGRERRADHRRQHGRGPARFRRGDEDLPQSDRGGARHRPRAGDGGFLEVLGDRDRLEVHPGQAGGEFDLAEGGRGRVHQARADRAPLRRGGGGDGVRRAGPGRYRSSARSRSASAPTTSW